jgi:hypothetical protein
MSKTRLQNIGLFLLGLIIVIMVSPIGISLCENFGHGDFNYAKGAMFILGIIIFVLSFLGGGVLSACAFIAYRRDEKISDI